MHPQRHGQKKPVKFFPIVMITGPRQVGKTTLFKICAKDGRGYVSLDNLEALTMAQNDPGLFVQSYLPPVIIDEVQYAPDLFSHIKIVVDREKRTVCTGLQDLKSFIL